MVEFQEVPVKVSPCIKFYSDSGCCNKIETTSNYIWLPSKYQFIKNSKNEHSQRNLWRIPLSNTSTFYLYEWSQMQAAIWFFSISKTKNTAILLYLQNTYRSTPLLILRHAYSSQPFGKASMNSLVRIVVLLRTWATTSLNNKSILKNNTNVKQVHQMGATLLTRSHVATASQRLKSNDKPSSSPVLGSFCLFIRKPSHNPSLYRNIKKSTLRCFINNTPLTRMLALNPNRSTYPFGDSIARKFNCYMAVIFITHSL